MPTVIRKYFNATDELLRTDTIVMTLRDCVTPPTKSTYIQNLSTVKCYSSADREVNYIAISGDFDSIETSSGNFVEAEWFSPVMLCNMSNLPQTGETI